LSSASPAEPFEGLAPTTALFAGVSAGPATLFTSPIARALSDRVGHRVVEMIGRGMSLQAEPVEQRSLSHRPFALHRIAPHIDDD
jgi:hypothetical protein